MAKIYISSTYVDLKKEREAASQAVRQLGHQAIAMEDYVAADKRPVDKCLQDVRSSDAYVGIFAWRYGFIPDGYDKSITHLEYEAAKKAGIPCLVFLTDNKAPWPVEYVTTGKERKKIDRLRKELMNEYVASFFKNTDQLGGQISASLSKLILMTERSFIKFRKPEELTGTQLGKYVIREKLGSGGKGVVFKVMDTLEEREKAIKMIPPRVADSPLAFKHLKKELNTAACIIHPNVVKVLGLEEHDGHFFIVMEYIEGKNLEQILAESSTGKLEESKVIDIMQKIAKGLLEIHKKNVIHRDIKPANIMVTPENQVKILDFGISYQVTRSMTELVGEHQWQGTWPYMAPEQLSTRYGRENKQVDIWGFGVTMYQLLSGEFPFTNKDQIKDIDENPYELEDVSPETKKIVMKCLEKDMKKRFIDMEEVLAALKAISLKFGEAEKEKRVVPVVPEPPPVKPTSVSGKEGKEIDFGDEIIMVSIPPGEFEMGSNDYDNEKPPHTVYLDGYWIGKYEVTVRQFGLFVKDTGYVTQAEKSGGALTWNGKNWEKTEGIDWKNPSFKQEDNHPVVCVTWNDALEYCKWLSGKKGDIFNLPTEAQWEKAARGIDSRKYPWGVRVPDETLANFSGKIGKTTPIGSYPDGASPYGLFDMVGNVWEWCFDWYDLKYYKNASKDNPIGPKNGTQRVQRGGSWVFKAKYLPCSFRGNGTPDICHYSVGFRLCQDNK
jgi:formylglycine-generating enzyme required for sulfatase activity/predicted Ser/Thr protein kinase